jgi:hypothetical protein
LLPPQDSNLQTQWARDSKSRVFSQFHQRAINSVLWHVSIPYFGTLLSRQESNLHSSDSESAMLPLHHETISRNSVINQIITLLGVRGESNPRTRDSQSRTDYQHLQLTQSSKRDSNPRPDGPKPPILTN